MKIAYFECLSGIAGDMILGAFIDLGMDVDFFKKEIKKLNLKGYKIDVKQIKKNNITASDICIKVDEKQPNRTLKDIINLIEDSTLEDDVKNLSKKIFYNLANAESKVHNVSVEKIHFHEVGAIDSIIDIIGATIAMKYFEIKDVYCSSLPRGSGFVICQHGKIPVPAPATQELLVGIPTYELDSGHELVTPTGAAIITTICSNFDKKPELINEKIGYGSGKIISSQPGVLKIVIGNLEKK
ncbi:MAG: LarC family nickel insertion protein [Candidatus Thermoplasmatota archaeon]|nr:LarC family nickel insertion protein [Candidatus Thermoplasmatota archaeon]